MLLIFRIIKNASVNSVGNKYLFEYITYHMYHTFAAAQASHFYKTRLLPSGQFVLETSEEVLTFMKETKCRNKWSSKGWPHEECGQQ